MIARALATLAPVAAALLFAVLLYLADAPMWGCFLGAVMVWGHLRHAGETRAVERARVWWSR